MRHILFALLAATTSFSAPSALADDSLLFIVPATRVFVPQGFDSNDTVQVVIGGTLTGTCEKTAHTQVNVVDDHIEVIQWGRRFPGICLPLTSTYHTEVTIGRLAAGSYQITALGLPDYALAVTEATVGSEDDYIYAPVDDIEVARDGGAMVAHLSGTLPNDCYKWSRMQLLDQGSVLVVLPILTYEDTGRCGTEPVAFRESLQLPADMPANYYLLHVRSASGHALNKVFFSDGD